MKEEYISIPELARRIGKERTTVFRWAQSGKLKALKVGRNYIVPVSEVERLKKKK
ncbi:MAG: helix-turn-helix domain-containing protein [Patescibacteria group bacterium]|nr:helix-turn-helix domain-containing protein [Patescibacteria group bacterium]